MDLVSTIGESVALGVAGVILWGDASYASSNVRDLFTVLYPYHRTMCTKYLDIRSLIPY